jgi:periplasmic protein TonB
MNFSKREADPRRHLTGIAVVIAFHAFIVYALVTGLAKKVVEVVRAPIETKVIEEIKKPPPPPEIVIPPPPKLEAPPPPFIPPPEVQVNAPPPPAPTITAVTATPPPAPVVIAPAPPPVVAAAPAPAPAPPPVAKPAGPVQAGTVCTQMPAPEAPAINGEASGDIVVLGTIKAGRVVQVEIEKNTVKGSIDRRALRLFVANVESALKEGYRCAGDNVQFRQEFHFDIK